MTLQRATTSKKIWGAASFVSISALWAFESYIILTLKLASFPIYASIIVVNGLIVVLAPFLELSGLRERLWIKWVNTIPTFIHKALLGVCLIWITALGFTTLLPALKKAYEE